MGSKRKAGACSLSPTLLWLLIYFFTVTLETFQFDPCAHFFGSCLVDINGVRCFLLLFILGVGVDSINVGEFFQVKGGKNKEWRKKKVKLDTNGSVLSMLGGLGPEIGLFWWIFGWNLSKKQNWKWQFWAAVTVGWPGPTDFDRCLAICDPMGPTAVDIMTESVICTSMC